MSEIVDRLRAMAGIETSAFYSQRLTLNQAADALEGREKLIAEMAEAIDQGADVNTPGIMDWVSDRLVYVYGEDPDTDFILSLRRRAEDLRRVLSKAQPK